jgi:hypothetical protein
MISRRTAISFSLVLLVGIGLLAWSGTRVSRARAFSLDLPFDHTSATLGAGRRACEAPIQSAADFGAIRAFGSSTGSPATLDFLVTDTDSGETLARGAAPVSEAFNPITATLHGRVPAGRRVTVCMIGAGPGPIALGGSSSAGQPVRLRVGGRATPQAVSLVMLQVRSQSFFSLLPTIFRRAALFRPGWVGAWTFWVLALILLAAALGLGLAVSQAAVEEDRR